MHKFNFCYQNSLINIDLIKKYQDKLNPEIRNIKKELKNNYNTNYAALNLPFDQELINKSKKLANDLKKFDLTMFIQIGIGGSKLGPVAVFDSIKGLYFNDKNPKCRFYSLDTIDQDLISSFIDLVNQEFKQNGKVAIAIVTKSGTTPEIIANGAIFIDLLKKHYQQDYNKYVYVITDNGSPLYKLASKNNYSILEIPKQVGGRFSVFSPVGLFSLSLFNIDITELCNGAKEILNSCLSEDIIENPAALSASIIFEHYKQGKNIIDTFLFSPSLRLLGEWYRQLLAESLGKEFDLYNKKVEVGITPTVSIGTTDLHSVAQLYLGGPRDKLTTFVNYNFRDSAINVPENNLAQIVPVLVNKSISTIKVSVFEGVTKAYKQNKRPFVTIDLEYQSPYSLGQFMMFKMCEVIYLGYLLQVNTFDQPAVEYYKNNTKEILKGLKNEQE